MRRITLSSIVLLLGLLVVPAGLGLTPRALAQSTSPAVGVSPSVAGFGTTATVSGSGFTPANWAYVYWQRPDKSTKGVWVYTDADGGFSTTLTFAASHGTGVEYVTAYDNGTHRWAAWSSMQVVEAAPTMTLAISPQQVAVGKQVTVAGTGFSPENWVFLQWTRPDDTTDGAWVSTDGAGSLSLTLGFLTSHGCGTETVAAYDNGTGVWTPQYSVRVTGC